MGFSLLNLLGHRSATPTDEVQFLFFSGPKLEVELRLRIAITVLALFLSLTFEAVDLYLPSRSLMRFRKRYLEEQRKEWRIRLHPDIRINIMYARRRWYLSWLKAGATKLRENEQDLAEYFMRLGKILAALRL
jgi:hypothetical protein